MPWRAILSGIGVTALVVGTAMAQPKDSSKPMEDPALLQQRIQDKLSEQGFKDVKIAPGSYVVSARDKDGNRVMMEITPSGMTVVKVPDENPSQAQAPLDSDDDVIEQ